jgi:hypothetical protein
VSCASCFIDDKFFNLRFQQCLNFRYRPIELLCTRSKFAKKLYYALLLPNFMKVHSVVSEVKEDIQTGITFPILCTHVVM